MCFLEVVSRGCHASYNWLEIGNHSVNEVCASSTRHRDVGHHVNAVGGYHSLLH